MIQPEVGTGRISFDDLEALTNVHQQWDRKGVGIHAVDTNTGPTQYNDGEFELAGELYRLEFQNGKRVPVKVNPNKRKSFKCFRCDRTGHFGRDCPHSSKADGSKLNPPPKPKTNKSDNKIIAAGNVEPAEVPAGNVEMIECTGIDLSCLDYVELSPMDVIDPWISTDPWLK